MGGAAVHRRGKHFSYNCHPDEAKSSAKPKTPEEEPALSLSKGSMQLASGTDEAP
ncbi:MAG: hypothetical protein WCC89_07655 [Candidatus Sulfotelmatobacter sp.]